MRGLRALWPIALGLATAYLLFAAGRSFPRDAEPAPLRLRELLPREVEPGDRIALLGEAFPPAKPARVSFRGTLRRPGERPVEGAEIVLTGEVVTAERVEIPFTEANQSLFCEAGERAMHTTFEGDVEVAFAATGPGAPPVAGRLEHVVLDARPSSSPSLAEREQEGARLLAWVGLQAAPGPAGLAVERVESGSRAQAAGLREGDLLESFDGVRVASPADVVPAPGEREGSVEVRSTLQGPSEARTLRLDGFRRAAPVQLFSAAALVIAALCAVVLFGAPTHPAVASAVQRFVLRVRERLSRERAGSARGALAREAVPPNDPTAIADLAAYALVAAMPFGQYVLAAQLDVASIFVTLATGLGAAALLSTRGSLGLRARAAASVLGQHLPAAVAVATVVVMTGSLRIQEIERAQSGWPWDWLVFRSPAALVAFGLLLSCARIDVEKARFPARPRSPGPALAAWVEEAGGLPWVVRGRWTDGAVRAQRVIVAGLASAVFLGGWLLPGLPGSKAEAVPGAELLGALWLLAKTFALVTAMAWTRWALPRRATPSSTLWVAPLAMAAFLVAALWTWFGPPPAEQELVSIALAAATLLAAAAVGHHVRHGLASAESDGRLSPFL